MEIDGHPTQDMLDELERRGAVRVHGTTAGPDPNALRFVQERGGEQAGFWVFLPPQAFRTGLDEIPE